MIMTNEAWGNICFNPKDKIYGTKRISGMEAGIHEGKYKVDFKDIMMMVPCMKNDDISAMFYAWGEEFNDARSLEMFTFSGNESTKKPKVGRVEKPKMLVKHVYKKSETTTDEEEGLHEGSSTVPMLAYYGVEGGIKESLSLKVKKHMEYVAYDVAKKGSDGRYAKKKWFIKSDTDTFIVTRHLLTVLSNYDPAEPWYIGYRFTKRDRKYISGGLYAMSREAVRRLNSKLKGTSVLRFEDMMIGAELQRAGVFPTEHKGFHWKRPYQREIEWGVVGGLVQVHKIKGRKTMEDLLAWSHYALGDY